MGSVRQLVGPPNGIICKLDETQWEQSVVGGNFNGEYQVVGGNILLECQVGGGNFNRECQVV